ncbi:MAG: PilZ domain-containing protein, partial [Pseudomonadota bacterium]
MLNRGGKKSSGKSAAQGSPRRHPRHNAKGKVRCQLGDVLDLSAGGMRVACDGKPALKAGSAAKVNLNTNAGREAV